ncbi:ABC transporter domain-containing protein [Neohortaea acidophila]|uniref:ABC transporter domain-containing protein n=1 Tax=Neohortaea acidophila TaxID=245834 RepID=A0A6A6PN23_9PEZI|nr:ABC transporter domain-containing protein [Neohortaea acidophila]KAF2480833.1 ABC transporter domain-containing protein [Neohortaea acidophila]
MWKQQCAIIDIRNATFYRHQYPSAHDTQESNPPLFPNLTFQLSNGGQTTPQFWSVLSPSSLARTTFLRILAGQHICVPPAARSYPYLVETSESLQHAIKYVGFDADRGSNVGGTSVRGAYLSARYESRREETDFSVHDYLTGHTELNALERQMTATERQTLEEVTEQLNLRRLLSMPVSNLSNGQTRRARIAKALMGRPQVLLLDGPFMGLDPNTLANMSRVLRDLAERQQPRLIISLRPEDGVPEWISHLVLVSEEARILAQGAKQEVFNSKTDATKSILFTAQLGHNANNITRLSRDGFPQESPALKAGEPLVEMNGVEVAYGQNEARRVVLGDWEQQVNGEQRPGLWWSLHRGQRSGIFGANGSGKTTMLSLITSDHPQTYSLPIKLFGRSRLPAPGEAGISLFDIQKRMGHSSPEVHAFFPKSLTVRRALESAWADAPMAKPRLDEEANRRVAACLRCFSNQRLLLFLRAIVASPDLVILDEALSGIDEATRDKALLFLSQGETVAAVVDGVAQPSVLTQLDMVVHSGLSPDQALLVISHSKEDVPGCVREWICLPEPGEGRIPRTGKLSGPLELNPQGWGEIWGERLPA